MAQLFVWAILLTVAVGLPALLHRSRLRAFRRNQAGACARCGSAMGDLPPGYMEGFKICSRCAALQRRSMRAGLVFLVLFAALGAVVPVLGWLQDARRGQAGPWWFYALVACTGPALIALAVFVWRASQSANRRAAARDAAAVTKYDVGGEYQ